MDKVRCPWANQSELARIYHDQNWGSTSHDELFLFQMLMLEGQQAGLSWDLILKKKPALLLAYDNFDPAKLIHYDEEKFAKLKENPEIIRNTLKIKAAKANALGYYKLCQKYQSIDNFLWSKVAYQPILGHYTMAAEVPTSSALSVAISQELKSFGFKFVGPTIIYSYLEAVGILNNHLISCFKYQK